MPSLGNFARPYTHNHHHLLPSYIASAVWIKWQSISLHLFFLTSSLHITYDNRVERAQRLKTISKEYLCSRLSRLHGNTSKSNQFWAGVAHCSATVIMWNVRTHLDQHMYGTSLGLRYDNVLIWSVKMARFISGRCFSNPLHISMCTLLSNRDLMCR